MSKRSQDPQFAEEGAKAGRAAQQAGLGEYRAGFINMEQGARKDKETGYLVYEFDGGLVYQQIDGLAEAFPWDRIDIVTQRSTHWLDYGSYRYTRFHYGIIRDDAAAMELTGTYLDPQQSKSKHADPASHGVRFNALGRSVAVRVSNAKLPGARAALAKGESLSFPMIRRFTTSFRRLQGDLPGLTFNAKGVAYQGGIVPWSQVRISIGDGKFAVRQVDKLIPLKSLRTETIPNLPLLITLTEELRATAK